MAEMIPKPLKKLWVKWNIRVVIILSLFLQTILIFCAPSRRRTANKLFLVLIWSAYLLADWAADYAVGQISDSQGEEEGEGGGESNKYSKNSELLAFWAPFLLLHLGGPDTITALALEDNELWERHLFSLICQAMATVYVILLSIPNNLLTPTVIMLVGGVIKYVERTSALFSASLDKFKESMLNEPDPGANYAKLMEEYEAKRKMNMPTEVIVMEDPEKGRQGNTPVRPQDVLTELQVVQYAYKYFNIFKGLIVDLIFTNEHRDESRIFFDSLNSVEALRIIEVELGLIYECIFTKAEILHRRTGLVFRFIASGCLVASLCLFKMKKKQDDEYDGFDVALTYALLICGIALDSIALLVFCVSDWTIAKLSNIISSYILPLRNRKEDLDDKETTSGPDRFLNWILSFRTLTWKRSQDGHQVLNRNCMFRRWSEYVHAYNLIGYCLKIPPKRIHHNNDIKNAINNALRRFCYTVTHLMDNVPMFSDVKDFFEEITFTTSDRLTKELWDFIFIEVKRKHRFAEDQESAKVIASARGYWTLVEASTQQHSPKLLRYVTEKDYDQSILLWHIATELLYQNEIDQEELIDTNEFTNRELSKLLSDYMMYLLMMQPTLMSAVSGIAKIRFRDTCAEANEFFHRRHIDKTRKDKLLKEATRAILSVNTEEEPINVKGDKSKSVLFDASVLAKELIRFKPQGKNMWEIVTKVWVELLCFAAIHCHSQEHASQLSKGCELISFVWLLMAHFGIGDQFPINRDDARAKLIVAK